MACAFANWTPYGDSLTHQEFPEETWDFCVTEIEVQSPSSMLWNPAAFWLILGTARVG